MTTITLTATSTVRAALEGVEFEAVRVTRGRKFRGDGFAIAGSYEWSRGYAGSGVDPYRCCEFSRVWDPVTKKYGYANSEFLDPREVSELEREDALLAYVNLTINETLTWCASVKPELSEGDLKNFARNCLRKRHPELRAIIDVALGSSVDVVAEIRSTLKWASTIKTRACYMYGRYCAGGKPVSAARQLSAARSALEHHGIAKLPGFEEAWAAETRSF